VNKDVCYNAVYGDSLAVPRPLIPKPENETNSN